MSRVDIFTPIHKALRAMTYDCAASLQTADLADAAAARRALDAVEHTLAVVEQHRDHEETFVFPEMDDRESGLIDELTAEHQEIGRLLERVLAAAAEVRAAEGAAERVRAGDELSRRFNEVVAAYLGHFAHEEADLLPASQRHLEDGRLVAIRERIIRSISPADYAEQQEWLFRSLNRSELVEMLGGVKATAPEAVFAEMVSAAQRVIGADRWADVGRDIGLSEERAA